MNNCGGNGDGYWSYKNISPYFIILDDTFTTQKGLCCLFQPVGLLSLKVVHKIHLKKYLICLKIVNNHLDCFYYSNYISFTDIVLITQI